MAMSKTTKTVLTTGLATAAIGGAVLFYSPLLGIVGGFLLKSALTRNELPANGANR